jgi:outer membrane protein assembly factor BamB
MRLPSILLAVAFVSILPAAHAGDENWTQFRGPNGTGKSSATGLPLKWSEQENVRWKTHIHDKGWSSPVVWGDQVWMTTAREDGKELFAVCVDRESGKILHDLKVFDIEKPFFCIPFNSYASPTPAIEAGRVYVHFGSAGTACLDTASGAILWQRQDLPCNHFRAAGSSPVLYGDLLFIIFDGVDLQYVVALDKATGKTVWKKDRNIEYPHPAADGDNKKGYGTPALVDVGGTMQLVCPSAEATIAYAPKTGDELWRVHHGGMNAATPPQYGHGRLFLTTASGGLHLLAVRPDGSGDVTKTHIDWAQGKYVPTRPCPLLVDDLLYMVSDDGYASCVEAKTGKMVRSVRLGDSNKFSASPVYADGRLYFASYEGATFVVEAGPELKILAVNELKEGCMATPAIAGKALFLRTKTDLYRLEQK